MKINKIFLITSLACSTILSVNLHANNNGKHEDTVTAINSIQKTTHSGHASCWRTR